jgi:hypothetical protein
VLAAAASAAACSSAFAMSLSTTRRFIYADHHRNTQQSTPCRTPRWEVFT